MTNDKRQMTKLTFLTGEYPPMQGGIADYTAVLAKHLSALGVQSSVLIDRKYPATPDALQESTTVYPVLSGWNWRTWHEIRQFLATHPTDILHIQYQAAAFNLTGWVNYLPRLLQKQPHRPKIVTTFHDLRIPYLFPKAGKLRQKAIFDLAKYSDAVICTNIEDAENLRRHTWATHLSEIPLGNNVPLAPPPNFDRAVWRQKLGVSKDAIVMAYFGFLNESKGGEDLILLLDELLRRGENAYLLMIGGDVGDSDPNNADYARRVRQMIAERGLSARIITTGYVSLPDVSANLLAADIAVMPFRDGISFRRTTLIAALAHGLPVISTTPSINLPKIVDGENVILLSPRDVGAFANAVTRVTNDPTLKTQLQTGAKKLATRFDWQSIAAETLRVYQSL